ncbi:zinc-binding dehydrogenase [Methylobacterium sp. E-066]|uniref:zinc-binding dehydrogenase n=1 Tax=Methylobacterium sp. E-066 TaxID=2836584 RepID=UPI001FB87920|nr:zinc-binding dehydrogenase [Methylobacterium sp. E-066]MCJ2138622.1 zinc-binding dehydrogenase [Methylobacterium sp. E-066]
MKAVVAGPEEPALAEVETPVPKPTEVLVRVRAAALNRADLAVAAGQPHGTAGGPNAIPGLEWAGEIVAVGAEVADFHPGDRVMCSGAGGYAEYAVADYGRTLPLPASMSFETAATLPVALQTMHDAIVTQARLRPGETVLIQGASSGVGLMALQIARWQRASVVIGTSRNPEHRTRLSGFGATLAVDTKDPTWPEQVRQATGGKGVDVIIDQVSAPVANGNMQAAAVLGRIINVGRLGGGRGEFDFDLHATKRISYIGVTNRTRSIEEQRTITDRVRADLWQGVADGQFSLPIDSRFPLANAPAALARMKQNEHFGKIVLRM